MHIGGPSTEGPVLIIGQTRRLTGRQQRRQQRRRAAMLVAERQLEAQIAATRELRGLDRPLALPPGWKISARPWKKGERTAGPRSGEDLFAGIRSGLLDTPPASPLPAPQAEVLLQIADAGPLPPALRARLRSATPGTRGQARVGRDPGTGLAFYFLCPCGSETFAASPITACAGCGRRA